MMKLLLCVLICLMSGCQTKPDIRPQESVTVVSETTPGEAYAWLNQYLDAFLPEGYKLPVQLKDGTAVSWSVASGHGEVRDGQLFKTDGALEYEPIVLEATVGEQICTFDKLLLLDQYMGYLMTYFSGDGDTKETVKYAFTYNGNLWYVLNDQQPVLTASKGTKRIRDPYIMRKKDGSFCLMATQGYDNPSIYLFDTDDLVNFENERLMQINEHEDGTVGKQAWAPEGFYDRTRDQYFIYWSSPEDGGMFCNYSDDMNTVGYPEKLLDTGFPVIDGTIVKTGYDYAIILKDERQPMEQYSQLFLGYSDTDYRHFDQFDMNYITGHQSEGPFTLKRDYDYILFYDDYTRSQFQAISYYDLRKPEEFEDIKMSDLIFPMENVKHASVIPITYKEWKRVTDVYGE